MSYIYKSNALQWEVYESLMRQMDEYIEIANDHSRVKYACYQTVIAAGCNLGPKAKELLSMRWYDLMKVGSYIFKLEKHRSALVIDNDFKRIINKNYRIVKPSFIQQYIVMGSVSSDRPLIARQFNTALSAIFDRFDLKIEDPSCMTFRKTFARKVWVDYGQSEEGIALLSKEFKLEKDSVRRMVR